MQGYFLGTFGAMQILLFFVGHEKLEQKLSFWAKIRKDTFAPKFKTLGFATSLDTIFDNNEQKKA